MHKNALWITRTAVLVALLVVLQALTMALGNTIITGSVVNLILIISVMICGFGTGLTVAIISPFMAKLFGIGPFWSLIPFIAVGNTTLISLWHLVGNRNIVNKPVTYVLALLAAAVAKALFLYVGVVRIAVPLLLDLPEQQAAVITGMFSVSQFVTAATGGVCATIILSTLKKAVGKST